MDQTLKDYLVSRSADADTIQQAARYYVSERTNYILPEEMRRQLTEAGGDPKALDQMLHVLKIDNAVLEDASLAILSRAWEEPGEAERVKRAMEAAKSKLPVIDPGTLALVAMFGLMYMGWLAVSGGKQASTTIVRHKPDGSFEEHSTDWFYPSPLSALATLNPFRVLGGMKPEQPSGSSNVVLDKHKEHDSQE